MNRPLPAERQHNDSPLILFVTGEAPRSRRAHLNLTAALDETGIDVAPPREIDLLREPQEAISFDIFATPALLHIEGSGHRRVLYGDLSDKQSLKDFLSAL
ncbi:hypothetical protein CWI75_02390 [Kineobactrum sediminis]|uniref:KaiB domain-containing protein n=1 Tax=Kineobactrum sediminis TaxID=1905677 RepID=A0A2N5Y751_9GAMM|nr:circadian clock KaiB family protein [Kineobactrum sediminis]PLW84214.1 hypothetical protein CWI75_02390 [Kineobactrum sediminis]